MELNNNILIPKWADQFSLKCGFSLPFYGNQALTRQCHSGSLKANRTQLCNAIGTDPTLTFAPHQIHGKKVLIADNSNIGHGAFSLENADDGDACITRQTGITLITSWADCIPIIMYDDITRTAAVIHSGWRGTAQNIIAETVKSMTIRSIQSSPANIWAAIGPGIRDCCYEIGDDTANTFLSMNDDIKKYVAKKDGRYRLDLQSVVMEQILQCGITRACIDRCTFCTCCNSNPSFFSCRKDGKDNFEGQAAFICMT